jgi:transposase
MGFIKYSIGIDISKDNFHCAILLVEDSEKVPTCLSSSKFDNKVGGFKLFTEWVNKHCKEKIRLHFVMEATWIYYEQLAWHLFKSNQTVSVVLPTKAKNYFRSTGIKSKNDKIDAKGLAVMGCQQQLRLWQPISENIYELRTLTRLYEDLQCELTSIGNRKHALIHSMYKLKEVIDILDKTIIHLRKQIAKVRAALVQLVLKDPILKGRFNLLNRLKGVGVLTFAVVVAETNGFALFTNQKQLISFCGYDAIENQSGKHNGATRMSKMGNAHVRRAMFMPAFTAVRTKGGGVFTDLYNRLRKNGKTKMQAYVAVQKKLLVMIYTIWKEDKPFDPQYNREEMVSGETDHVTPQAEVSAKKNQRKPKAKAEKVEVPKVEKEKKSKVVAEKEVVRELARTTQGRFSKKETWNTAFEGFENTSKNPI